MLAQPLKLPPLRKAIFEVFLGIECPSLFRAGKHSDSTTLESFSFFSDFCYPIKLFIHAILSVKLCCACKGRLISMCVHTGEQWLAGISGMISWTQISAASRSPRRRTSWCWPWPGGYRRDTGPRYRSVWMVAQTRWS